MRASERERERERESERAREREKKKRECVRMGGERVCMRIRESDIMCESVNVFKRVR